MMPSIETYVLDACALLRLAQDEDAETIADMMAEAQQGKCRLLMHIVNLGEAVARIARRRGELQSVPPRVAALHTKLSDVKQGVPGTAFAQRAHGSTHRIAQLACTEIGRFAQPEQKHTLGRDAFDGRQQQRGVELALEVALAHDRFDAALRCAIERACGIAQSSGLEDPDHDATGLLLFRGSGFYAKLHLGSLVLMNELRLLRRGHYHFSVL